MKNKILIIEDNDDLQSSLGDFLTENYFSVEKAATGAMGMKKVEEAYPDLVILDLGLPDIDGQAVCKKLKEDYPELPIIILTAKSTSQDIIAGLKLGADDYVVKPFDLDVLLARIKARLRDSATDGKLVVGDLSLDTKKFVVTRNGKKISLTPTEFSLLEYLMKNSGRVLTREMILNRVWSYENNVETRAVDVYIGYLRKKIDAPFKKKLIKSVRGFGYLLQKETES